MISLIFHWVHNDEKKDIFWDIFSKQPPVWLVCSGFDICFIMTPTGVMIYHNYDSQHDINQNVSSSIIQLLQIQITYCITTQISVEGPQALTPDLFTTWVVPGESWDISFPVLTCCTRSHHSSVDCPITERRKDESRGVRPLTAHRNKHRQMDRLSVSYSSLVLNESRHRPEFSRSAAQLNLSVCVHRSESEGSHRVRNKSVCVS